MIHLGLKLNIFHKFIPVLIILALIGLGLAGYFYYQYHKLQQATKNPQTNQADLIKKTVAEVGKLILLPSGEEPVLATVSDVEKLKNQAFYKDAKNGDQVLIYRNAKEAFLYDPVAKKIINVGPVNISTPSAQASSQPQAAQPAPSLRIVLRNGTSTGGLATKTETLFKQTNPNLVVISKDNTTKDNYDKTIVIVLNPASKDQADSLAKSLNAQIGELPAGESKVPNADLLIILGKDRI